MSLVTTIKKNWIVFAVLGFIWGSSFMFIKIAVTVSGPITLVAGRLTFALLVLIPVAIRSKNIPSYSPRVWYKMLFIALSGTLIPFILISWAEMRIDSGLTAILIATTPLFAMLIADAWLKDSPLSKSKVFGVIVGIAGIYLLMSDRIETGQGVNQLSAMMAVVGASICYAVSTTFVRKQLAGMSPSAIALGQTAMACIGAWACVLVISDPVEPINSASSQDLISGVSAIAWLGIMCTGLASLLYYRLVQSWGASRASTVTYMIPVISVFLGVLVLDEQVGSSLLLGGMMIIGGIIFANRGASGVKAQTEIPLYEQEVVQQPESLP